MASTPRFTGKTRITGKTAEIPERPKNYRETLIGALAKTLLINEYNKKYMLFIICDIYIFNCAYNLTYFSNHLEYERYKISLKNVVSVIHMLVCSPSLIMHIDWVVSS